MNIRRGEHQRDNDADDETANGEFFAHRTRRIVCNHRSGQGVAINSAGAVPDSAENGTVGNRNMAGGLGSRSGRSAVAVERCWEASERQLVWNGQIGQDAVPDAPAHTSPSLFRLSPCEGERIKVRGQPRYHQRFGLDPSPSPSPF